MEETYKISDIIFNHTTNIRYCYIKPILTSLTGLYAFVNNNQDDWVVISHNEENTLTKIYRKILG